MQEATLWEHFLLELGCRAPTADALSGTTWLLPALDELRELPIASILQRLPARTRQWLRESLHMLARSGAIVSVGALLAEHLLQTAVLEGVEVVEVPTEMQEVAEMMGICIRPDAEMCSLALDSSLFASLRLVDHEISVPLGLLMLCFNWKIACLR